MTLEMKLAEERKEGYEEGAAAGYENGAAAQRAKDEAEIAQLKAEIEKLRSKEL